MLQWHWTNSEHLLHCVQCLFRMVKIGRRRRWYLVVSHYVDWVFNGKKTSHFQFLQKTFILDVCKSLKKILIIKIFPFRYPFWNHLDQPDKSEIFWRIWHQMSKHFIFLNQKGLKNSHGLFRGHFYSAMACIYQVWMFFCKNWKCLVFLPLKLKEYSVVCLEFSYQSFQFSSNSSSTFRNL